MTKVEREFYIDKEISLPTNKKRRVSIEESPPTKPDEFTTLDCNGILFIHLNKNTSKNQDTLLTGFRRALADGLHAHATSMSNLLEYPVDDRLYCGVVDNYLTNKVAFLVCNNFLHASFQQLCGIDFVERYSFVAADCNGQSIDSGPCSCCISQIPALRQRLLYCSKRQEEISAGRGKRISTLHSPTLLQARARSQTMMLKQQRAKVFRLEKRLEKMKETLNNADEGDISPELKESLKIDHQADLFSNQVRSVYLKIFEKDSTDQKALATALFDEQRLQAERAKNCGKKNCRYSNVMMMFCVQLRIKLGHGRYGFLSQVAGFPSNASVQKKMSEQSSAATNPNGSILDKSLLSMKKQFHQLHGKIPTLDGRRLVSIGYDTTAVVSGLQKSATSNIITGLSYDYEEGENALKAAIRSFANVFVDDQENATTTSTNEQDGSTLDADLVERAEHFGVFIATTLDKESMTSSRTVARYALSSVDSEFLTPRIHDVLNALWAFGFIGVLLGSDGATENRSTLNQLLTHSVDDLITMDYLPVSWRADSLIPTQVKIALLHPCFRPEDKVFVIAHPDMPHICKKLINAMENSDSEDKKRDLKKNGCRMNLGMVEDVWQVMEGEGRLRSTKLSRDHFDKNPNSRMRSYLAFQITSQSTYDMIKQWLKQENVPEGNAEYEELMQLIYLFNNMIDIMNGMEHKGKFGVDNPSHPDLQQLLDVVRFLEEWRLELGVSWSGRHDNFIATSTFQDVVWMSLGSIFLVHRYANNNFGKYQMKIDLGVCGSDCCEYRFGNLKGRYTHRLTIENANNGTHLADNMRGQAFNIKASTNTSGKKDIPTALLKGEDKEDSKK